MGSQPARVRRDRGSRGPDGHDPAGLRSARTQVLAARALWIDAHTWIEDGGLELAGAAVRRVLSSPAAVRRAVARGARLVDLDTFVLTPGLVNAHAHLDLGAFAGRVPPGSDFAAWIRALLVVRARVSRSALERGFRAGVRALLASGTTAVGDIDGSGTSARLARELRLGGVTYREVLDAWDPARTAAALVGAARRGGRGPARPGLAPHAPYTTSAALLAGVARLAARRELPLAIHWAETREEVAWLREGSGPLAALLPTSPRRSGLALLDAAGLLGPRTALVHGNFPARGEAELLARRGVTLVHCPGTHRFFARPRFPLARYRRAGVPLALGTDSLASNGALDLRREMALLRAAFPELAPAEVFGFATEGGARALARPELGHARPGAVADLVAWELAGRTRAAALEELTAAAPTIARTFLAGRPWRAGARSGARRAR